jgi:hypothetical protein
MLSPPAALRRWGGKRGYPVLDVFVAICNRGHQSTRNGVNAASNIPPYITPRFALLRRWFIPTFRARRYAAGTMTRDRLPQAGRQALLPTRSAVLVFAVRHTIFGRTEYCVYGSPGSQRRPAQTIRCHGRVEDGIPLAQGIAGSPRVPAGGPSLTLLCSPSRGFLMGA